MLRQGSQAACGRKNKKPAIAGRLLLIEMLDLIVLMHRHLAFNLFGRFDGNRYDDEQTGTADRERFGAGNSLGDQWEDSDDTKEESADKV